jgi:antirestriction protein ArdC
MSAPAKETIYERITGNIIAALERGVAPWVRPWAVSLPYNVVSGRHYNGVNILGCLAHQLEHGHTCSAYLTLTKLPGRMPSECHKRERPPHWGGPKPTSAMSS